MEIFRIAAIALITAFCVLVLREAKSELAPVVALVGGLVVVLSVINYFSDVFSVISSVAKKAGLAASVVTLLFKVIAIGYVTEFSSSIMDDMGLSSLSDKVTLAGKLIIVAMSLPIVVQLFNFIAGLLA
ncbi:MAG: stage III sporulation AC/AD family protein [Clostridiales bacterium]|nr:stage III sporulation AC/AD family protein [Clostridiales bacterium]